MKKSQLLTQIVSLLLVAGIADCSYIFFSAERRIRALCLEINPGMSLSELNAFASQHGLGPAAHARSVIFLVEIKTFGRYGCKITMDNGVVREAAYNYAD